MTDVLASVDATNPPIQFTWFTAAGNPSGVRRSIYWPEFCAWIAHQLPRANTKDELPLIKLATFAGDYRSNTSVEAVHGIEGDYDGGKVPPDIAAATLQGAGIEALIITTPSHHPDAPRWRILAPLSRPHHPQDRHALVGRLNGALGGILALESFTVSQAFYIGSVATGAPLQCWRSAGRPIDTMGDLPTVAPSQADGRKHPLGTQGQAPSYEIALAALRSRDPYSFKSDRNGWLAYSGAFASATHDLTGAESAEADWQAWNRDANVVTFDAANDAKTWRDFQRSGTHHGWEYLRSNADLRNMPADVVGRWLFEPHRAYIDAAKARIEDANATDEFFHASELDGEPTPAREWLVRDFVPSGTVTLLGGDGGTGKTLLTLQLATAVVLNRAWLGQAIERAGPALFISAEDDKAELHRRMADVAASERASLADLHWLVLRSLAGENALLGTLSARGELIPTPLYNTIDARIAALRPTLVVLDPLADMFPGNENDRGLARQFVGLLRGLAIRHRCAVVLLAHPSLTGLNTGTGTSGSTGWSNSVRSRLYFERITEDGYEPNVDARRLKVMKLNYGRIGKEISVHYHMGAFRVSYPGSNADSNAKAERVFLKLLTEFGRQGRDVSASPGPNFAPKTFSDHAEAEGCTKSALKDAMDRLLTAAKIKIIDKIKSGHTRSCLAVVD